MLYISHLHLLPSIARNTFTYTISDGISDDIPPQIEYDYPHSNASLNLFSVKIFVSAQTGALQST